MEEKQFYNIIGDRVSKEEHDESMNLLLDLINYGKLVKVQINKVYGYMQEFYKYNNKMYIVTKKDNNYMYIERLINNEPIRKESESDYE